MILLVALGQAGWATSEACSRLPSTVGKLNLNSGWIAPIDLGPVPGKQPLRVPRTCFTRPAWYEPGPRRVACGFIRDVYIDYVRLKGRTHKCASASGGATRARSARCCPPASRCYVVRITLRRAFLSHVAADLRWRQWAGWNPLVPRAPNPTKAPSKRARGDADRVVSVHCSPRAGVHTQGRYPRLDG